MNTWSGSFVDPFKLAAAQLRTSRPEPYRPLGDSFASITDRLQTLEHRAIEQQKSNDWLRGVSRDLARGMRTPTMGERQAMERAYGIGQQTRPFGVPPRESASAHIRPLTWYAQGLR